MNDAYMRAWNSIPPKKPENLRTFLGKMVRNLALDRCERARAQKRGGGQYALALEEMEECVPSASDTEQSVDGALLSQLLNDFLAGMKPEARNIFMRRYWYLSSVKDIAAEFGFSESKAMWFVVVPQAVKNILPALGNEFIMIVKDTPPASSWYISKRSRTTLSFATDKTSYTTCCLTSLQPPSADR